MNFLCLASSHEYWPNLLQKHSTGPIPSQLGYMWSGSLCVSLYWNRSAQPFSALHNINPWSSYSLAGRGVGGEKSGFLRIWHHPIPSFCCELHPPKPPPFYTLIYSHFTPLVLHPDWPDHASNRLSPSVRVSAAHPFLHPVQLFYFFSQRTAQVQNIL